MLFFHSLIKQQNNNFLYDQLCIQLKMVDDFYLMKIEVIYIFSYP